MIIRADQRFGRLVTVSVAGRSADGHRNWLCRCDCGTEVVRQSNSLQSSVRNAVNATCGCSRPEEHATHGMRYSATYSSWQAAKRRCINPEDKDYPRYGGRGIRMRAEWADSFEAFHAYMGDRPAGTTLDRNRVDGHYEPGNCRWATAKDQARNRRSSIYVNWRGVETHLCVVADDLGITYGAAFQRLKRGKLQCSI